MHVSKCNKVQLVNSYMQSWNFKAAEGSSLFILVKSHPHRGVVWEMDSVAHAGISSRAIGRPVGTQRTELIFFANS